MISHLLFTESLACIHSEQGWQKLPAVPAVILLSCPQFPVLHLVAQNMFGLQRQCTVHDRNSASRGSSSFANSGRGEDEGGEDDGDGEITLMTMLKINCRLNFDAVKY